MKNKIMTYLFMFILFSFMILSFIFKDNLVSVSERRKLATFPSFSWQTILDNSYFSELNSYLVDQFPFRNSFRKIKAIFASSILKQKESHGVLEKDGYLFQIDASINEKSVSYFLQKINGVNREYLKNQNIYFAMIPDKNYYLTDDGIPKLDYLELENELKENLEAVENFKGSRDEKLVVLYCKQLGINYKNLSDEEFRWLIRILKKSKKMGTPISQRKKR